MSALAQAHPDVVAEDRPLVSVVLPAHNEAEFIDRVLDAVLAQDYPCEQLEVIVVDNGSTDETVALAAAKPGVTVLQQSGSIAAVRNAGWRHARGEIVAFLDADCIVEESWLSTAIAPLIEQANVSIVSATIRVEAPEHAPWIERYWIENHRARFVERITRTSTISSFCFLMRRSTLERTGGFNEALVTCEDVDLGYRVSQLGETILVDRELQVVHLGNARTLRGFFTRQWWQGGSNLKNARQHEFEWGELKSLCAPLLYLALLIAVPVLLLLEAPVLAALALLLALAMPLVVALLRSPVRTPGRLPGYYLIWSVYLLARALGVFGQIGRGRR